MRGYWWFQISVSFPQVIDPKWQMCLLALHTSNHQFTMAWKGHAAVTTRHYLVCFASWPTTNPYHKLASVWKDCLASFQHYKTTRHLQLRHLNVKTKQLEIFILSGLIINPLQSPCVFVVWSISGMTGPRVHEVCFRGWLHPPSPRGATWRLTWPGPTIPYKQRM